MCFSWILWMLQRYPFHSTTWVTRNKSTGPEVFLKLAGFRKLTRAIPHAVIFWLSNTPATMSIRKGFFGEFAESFFSAGIQKKRKWEVEKKKCVYSGCCFGNRGKLGKCPAETTTRSWLRKKLTHMSNFAFVIAFDNNFRELSGFVLCYK